MRTSFDKPTTIRVKRDISERVRAIAEREGNTEASVLRRALAEGLSVICGQKTAGSPDGGRAA